MSSARRRTSRRVFKGPPNRIGWSSPRARGSFLGTCSNSKTWEPWTSRASLLRRGRGRCSRQFRGKPLRGAAFQRPPGARRARRRMRIAATSVVECKGRRGPGSAALRRGRYRQIPDHRGAVRTAFAGTSHQVTLFLLAAAHRQRAVSDHWPNGTRRRVLCTTMRHKRSSTSSMRCSRRPRLRSRTPRCSPRCFRLRTTDAIRHSI